MRTVFAIEDRPDIIGTPNQVGLQSMVVRSSQTLALTPNFHAEVGNELQAIRLGEMQVANHPFGGAVWSNGENSVAYGWRHRGSCNMRTNWTDRTPRLL